MSEIHEMFKIKQTKELIIRNLRATRNSHKISDLIEALGQTWLSDPDLEEHAWVIYKNNRGYMYMKVYQPGCTRLGTILKAILAVKMSGYISEYNYKEDYLIMRIFA